MYNEDDFLSLSGIQHFIFCRRQWALIHIEQQWQENLRTVEGEILHENAHDVYSTEKRGGVILSRALPVFSKELGIRGACDIVEFHQSRDGVNLFGRDGLYLPIPVEYKHGKPKETEEDISQLVAQAICLEEMLLCEISYGFLYYGEIKRRVKVTIEPAIRQKVRDSFVEMHALYNRRYTPKVRTGKHCRACSLADICLPKLCRNTSALMYITSRLEEETT